MSWKISGECSIFITNVICSSFEVVDLRIKSFLTSSCDRNFQSIESGQL
jgi:hypothetical protein